MVSLSGKSVLITCVIGAIFIPTPRIAAQPAAVSSAARATSASVANTTRALLNPIRLSDTADPGVVYENGTWYFYHTSSGSRAAQGRYPIVASKDLKNFETLGHILAHDNLPAWCTESRSWWAPEVHKVGNKFIAYFTTRENGTNKFAIGAAIANAPAGPFEPLDQPIKKVNTVGLIDVSWFADPNTGKQYLIWKEDRNDFNPPQPTPLIMQEMAPDGIHLVGEAREILRNDQQWEGVLVEAPSLVFHNGWYYLFYSGNMFSTDDYAVGVARSRDIWGPYTKNPRPILTHDEHFSGPGHQFVIQDEQGGYHLFYHARLKKLDRSHRYLMHDMIRFGTDGWPHINNGHPGPVNPDAVEAIKEAREAAAQRAKARTKTTSTATTSSTQ